MAFFKFRWPGQQGQGEQAMRPSRVPHPESIEVMRRRARHRLIGAAVLVLLGVVGLPKLFDTQPRPIPVNTPIEIPDRNKVAPLVVPGAPEASGLVTGEQAAPPQQQVAIASVPSVPVPVAPPPTPSVPPPPSPLQLPPLITPKVAPPPPQAPAVAPATKPVQPPAPPTVQKTESKPEPKPVPPPAPKSEVKPEPKPTPKPEPKPEVKPEPKPVPKPEAKPEPKPESKPEPKAAPKVDDAARARALLEGRSLEAPTASARAERSADNSRVIVQIGAFADEGKANEIRQKLERAGLKTYTQTIETKDGKRTRVRVGPFNGRADGDKAAERVKGLGLPASVLTQ